MGIIYFIVLGIYICRVYSTLYMFFIIDHRLIITFHKLKLNITIKYIYKY